MINCMIYINYHGPVSLGNTPDQVMVHGVAPCCGGRVVVLV